MNEASLLCLSAAGIGLVHTALGPDHYLPFVAMSRTGGWPLKKTLLVTVLCGLGHVLGSIVLGTVGIAAGTAVFRLEKIESARGDIASWLLIAFGLCYFSWAVVRAARHQKHTHWHAHAEGTVHCHEHQHDPAHRHVHRGAPVSTRGIMTPWILFTIFVFGPCEPLIPLLMYPAASGSVSLLVAVTFVFATATLGTMTLIVWIATTGIVRLIPPIIEKVAQPIAGLVILACGVAVKAGL